MDNVVRPLCFFTTKDTKSTKFGKLIIRTLRVRSLILGLLQIIIMEIMFM